MKAGVDRRRACAAAGRVTDRARRAGHRGNRIEGRLREQPALHQPHAGVDQHVALGRGFNAFGDDRDAQFLAGAQHAPHDGAAGATLVDVADQFHVDLDVVRLEQCQQVQAGIAGPEIIDRRLESQALILGENFAQPARIADPLAFGGFEQDLLDRKVEVARRIKRRPDAHLGPVDRIGQKVDRQQFGHAKARCALDRRAAADLVEPVAVPVIHLVEHRRRTFSSRTADKRLVREDAAIAYIDDRLIGEGDTEGLFSRSAAALAAGAFLPDGKRTSHGQSMVTDSDLF